MAHALQEFNLERVVPGLALPDRGLDFSDVWVYELPRYDGGGPACGGRRIAASARRRKRRLARHRRAGGDDSRGVGNARDDREQPAPRRLRRKDGIEVIGLERIVLSARTCIGDCQRKVPRELPLEVQVPLIGVIAMEFRFDIVPGLAVNRRKGGIAKFLKNAGGGWV